MVKQVFKSRKLNHEGDDWYGPMKTRKGLIMSSYKKCHGLLSIADFLSLVALNKVFDALILDFVDKGIYRDGLLDKCNFIAQFYFQVLHISIVRNWSRYIFISNI